MDLQIKDTNPMYLSCSQASHCGRGMVLTINAPTTPMDKSHAAFKAAAIRIGNPGLGNAGIQAAAAVSQVASTVSIKPQGVGAAAATGAAPGQPAASVVPGTGTTGSGQSCGCQCLCGTGSFPAGAGAGAFGGVGGKTFPFWIVKMGANFLFRSDARYGRDVSCSCGGHECHYSSCWTARCHGGRSTSGYGVAFSTECAETVVNIDVDDWIRILEIGKELGDLVLV